MDRVKPWTVGLLLLAIAVVVGFHKMEKARKAEARALAGDRHEVPAATDNSKVTEEEKTLCRRFFLGLDEDGRGTAVCNGPFRMPDLDTLPPLPVEYWPSSSSYE